MVYISYKKEKSMKKSLIFSLTILVTMGMLFPRNITITSPDAGNAWAKGSTFNITWNSQGCTDPDIKINIFKDSITVSNFVEQLTTSGTNSKSWRIPMSYIPGNYYIRVKTSDGVCVGDSPEFRITNPPTVEHPVDESNTIENQRIPSSPPFGKLIKKPTRFIPKFKSDVKIPSPSIRITFPPKDHNWRLKLGNTSLPFPIRIMWLKTGVGSQGLSVRIYLKRVLNGVQTTILTQSTPNDGLWQGEISRDLITSLYTIIIQTLDGKIRVESDTFYITNAENDPN